jgi:Tol biopolymer transport system component
MPGGLKGITLVAVAMAALSGGAGLAFAGGGPPRDAAAGRPSPNTRILYQGFDTVRSVRPDGSHQSVLAHVDLDPSHHIISLRDLAGSKNGKRIVVTTETLASAGPGSVLVNRIIRYNGRGRQRKPLFHPFVGDGVNSIAISADGRRIVYPKDGDLYIAGADGHGVRRLTHGANAKHPAISTDGRRIAFERNTSGNQDIWGMNTSGGPITRLTSSHADETWPAFSPPGAGIAYGSDAGGGELRVMSARGTMDHVVTRTHAGEETRPDFSPGGGSIVYVGRAGGGFALFTIRVNGSHRKLVGEAGAAKGPQWTRLP